MTQRECELDMKERHGSLVKVLLILALGDQVTAHTNLYNIVKTYITQSAKFGRDLRSSNW